ncbi:MAG: LuxR C-terminal-related transcriptional regulator [Cytophagaceae bacterium]
MSKKNTKENLPINQYLIQSGNLAGRFKEYESLVEGIEIKKSAGLLMQDSAFLSFTELFPGIVALADFAKGEYLYIKNMEAILGYSSQDFFDKGISFTLTLFPPEHNEVIINQIFPTMFSIIQEEAAKGKVEGFRISYPTRMIMKSGKTSWFLHQINILQSYPDGKHLALKLLSEIEHVKKDESITLSISKKDNKGIYFPFFTKTFIPGQQKEELSNRELEVLSLLSQGKSSKEIADMLFLSEHTVYNHRKNMLKKLKVNRTADLVSKAFTNGLI